MLLVKHPIFITVIKHQEQKQLEEEHIYLMLACKSITEGSEGRNVDADTAEEAMEE